MLPFKRILFPTDFSNASLDALPRAVEIVEASGASLVLIHVLPVEPPTPWDVPPYADFGLAIMPVAEYRSRLEQEVDRRLRDLAQRSLPVSLPTTIVVRQGDPAHEIVDTAQREGVDLVVMATHGWTGWRHFVFGSVTERVLREAACPVLVLRPIIRPVGGVSPTPGA